MNATRVEKRETKDASRHARRGFTLVELMVVIGIIVILISILGVTLSHMTQQAKETATNTTITKLHRMLEQRMEAFDRAMDQIEKNASRDPAYQTARRSAIIELNNLKVPVNNAQLKILVRKRFKQSNFPQRLEGLGSTGDSSDITESSERLYLMLTEGEVGGAAPVDAGEFLASEVGDTDGDGLIEFIDAWGSPLRFYRRSTRLFKSDGTNHTEGPSVPNDHDNVVLLIQGSSDDLVDSDPDDPLEKLSSVITTLAAKSTSFEQLYHTPYTYHVPLIVSAGADGELGMGEPNSGTLAHRLGQVTDSELILDNFTNRNQRSGD